MLDHVSVGARDFGVMRRFYVRVLAAVGLTVVDEEQDKFVDFADARQQGRLAGLHGVEFSLETPTDGQPASAGNGVHIAFIADGPAAVEAFHAAALAFGGRSGGGPGPRPQYGPDYYSAFVLDPEGNKIEAVWASHSAKR